MHTYLFVTLAPNSCLSSLSQSILVVFGGAVVVAGVDAVVERPTPLLFLGALAFFCR